MSSSIVRQLRATCGHLTHPPASHDHTRPLDNRQGWFWWPPLAVAPRASWRSTGGRFRQVRFLGAGHGQYGQGHHAGAGQ